MQLLAAVDAGLVIRVLYPEPSTDASPSHSDEVVLPHPVIEAIPVRD